MFIIFYRRIQHCSFANAEPTNAEPTSAEPIGQSSVVGKVKGSSPMLEYP